MMSSPRDLRRWVSPDAVAFGSAVLRRGVRFEGSYPDWQTAEAHAGGYDQASILERAIAATEEVLAGRAAFDRDGVAFKEPYYPYPLIAGLLDGALRAGGVLSVVDFGGALGSTYFQCRPWLQGVTSIRWSVVEQPHYVEAGRQRFESPELKFMHSISECLPAGPTVALFSSVLQYLPNPEDSVGGVIAAGIPSILVARTPIVEMKKSVIAIQQVPASIIASSYPVRLFTRGELLQMFGGCALQDEYEDGQDRPVYSRGGVARFKGFVFRNNS